MITLYGKKLGMSQKFSENGDLVPVTVIKCGPCCVVQKKTREKEGYVALQLGFQEVKKVQRVGKAIKGHFENAKTPIFKFLSEFRSGNFDQVKVGDSLGVEVFQVGDLLNVRGCSKGKGFQGVVKRYGMGGGGAAHGSCFHRAPGSIGMNSSPSRVFKNKKMPGHMGDEFVTVRNLEVVDIDREHHLLFVRGAVPGANNGFLKISNVKADLIERLGSAASSKEIKEDEAVVQTMITEEKAQS